MSAPLHEENLFGLRTIQEQTFLGVRLTQSWVDLKIWELVLNAYPHLRSIVEIGTWEGGMSRYLNAQAEERGMRFLTMDNSEPPRPPPGFLQVDVFERAAEVRALLRALEPLILFCDGGDKPREMKEFGPALTPGSIIAVHDWLDEAGPADVPSCLEGVYGSICAEMGSRSQFFVRREINECSVTLKAP